MAKKQRFPSPANQPKGGAKDAAQAAPGPLPDAVSVKNMDMVQVEYKKVNHHILGIGAHALGKGINTLPASVWEEAKKHPSVQKLLADGHAVDLSPKKAAPAEEVPADAEEDSAEGDDADENVEG